MCASGRQIWKQIVKNNSFDYVSVTVTKKQTTSRETVVYLHPVSRVTHLTPHTGL